MKLSIENNLIVARAETAAENFELLKLIEGPKPAQPQAVEYMPMRTRAKRKRDMFAKKCEECGKEFRGSIGLATHRRKAHGVAGAYLSKSAYLGLSWQEKKEAIVKLYQAGQSVSNIARRFKVKKETVNEIIGESVMNAHRYGDMARAA